MSTPAERCDDRPQEVRERAYECPHGHRFTILEDRGERGLGLACPGCGTTTLCCLGVIWRQETEADLARLREAAQAVVAVDAELYRTAPDSTWQRYTKAIVALRAVLSPPPPPESTTAIEEGRG